jgi:phosphate transport system substrate-binding protein
MRRSTFWAALAAAALMALPAQAGTMLRGAGSTFAAPLYEAWAEAFGKQGDTAITYEAVGSGEGVRRFINGAVDFGGSDVPLSDSEAQKISGGAVMVPSTAGMIVIAYNLPGLEGELRLPRTAIQGIFSGRVRTWDDPEIVRANPGLKLPASDIALVVRQESSGTTAAFTSHLAAVNPAWAEGPGVGKLVAWPAGVMFAHGNEGVASRVKISEGSIGYVEYGFAKRLGLAIALIENKSGHFVTASETSGSAALSEFANRPMAEGLADPHGDGAYPIVSYSWLLLHKHYDEPGKAEAIKNFVRWSLTNGQSKAEGLGYLPLPPGAGQLGLQALDTVN